MKIEVKYSYSSLVSSILFLILGTILFAKADSIITILSYIIGSILIIIGGIKYVVYCKDKKANIALQNDLISAVILLVFGILCFFLGGVLETLVRYIIGAWILFVGLNRLINVFTLEKSSNINRLSILIISFLLIVIGLYVILRSNLVFKWIGILMIIYSILDIIGYLFFTHHKIINEKLIKNK